MHPDTIIIHCSDSDGGTARDIDAWHQDRGFKRDHKYPGVMRHIGYHYVIQNGRTMDGVYDEALDGLVVRGRHETEVGAHAYGSNDKSIGICLIGKNKFSGRQIATLYGLLVSLKYRWAITSTGIIGHCETPYEHTKKGGKTCPNMDMSRVRDAIRDLDKVVARQVLIAGLAR